MKRKILLSSFAILGILAAAGAVSAQGGFGWMGMGNFDPEKLVEKRQTMFENQAEMLGVEASKIKNYWAEGKNFREMAEAEGISDEELLEKMKEARKEEMNERMKVLVENGVITQEQADARLEFMEERTTGGKFGGGLMGKGHGRRGDGGCKIEDFNNASNNQQ